MASSKARRNNRTARASGSWSRERDLIHAQETMALADARLRALQRMHDAAIRASFGLRATSRRNATAR